MPRISPYYGGVGKEQEKCNLGGGAGRLFWPFVCGKGLRYQFPKPLDENKMFSVLVILFSPMEAKIAIFASTFFFKKYFTYRRLF